MSLLTTVQRAATLIGLPKPSVAASSLERNVSLLVELARIETEELADRTDWPALVTERSFTTVASVDQPTALPSDFRRFAFTSDDRGALYDTGYQDWVGGPASPNQWRSLTSFAAGWTNGWRVAGGVLQLAPAPAAGRTITFNYITNNFYHPATGANKATWDTDADTALLPEAVIALGVVWRFKQARGLEYAEDMASAERAIERAIGTGAGRRILLMGRVRHSIDADIAFPGNIIP